MTEWIPVSERLPEREEWFVGCGWIESDDVLVCYGASWIAVAKYVQKTVKGKTVDRWEMSDGATLKSVTAWMPLPKPYKGEQDE